MASNLELNAGSGGANLLTKQVTHDGDTTQLQGIFVGIVSGTEDSYTYTVNPGGAGNVSAGVQRVTIATDDANLAAIKTAVETIDNPVSGNEMLIAGGATQTNDVKVTLDGEAVSISGTVTVDLGANNDVTLAELPDTASGDLAQINANTVNLEKCIVQDDAPFTPATGYLMMIGGEHDDDAPDSVDEGDAGSVRISSNRSMHVQIRDGRNGERGLVVDANGYLTSNLAGNLPDTAAGDFAAMVVDLAAIEVLLGTIDTDTGNIATNTSTIAGDTTSIDGKITACDTGSIAGTVTANAGTNLNTSALALEAGGNLADIETNTDYGAVVGEGVITAATLRVTQATDDDGVAHLATIAGAVSTEMQCDIVAALPAGDNNIGNVDIASSVALDVSAATVTVDNGGTFATQATLQTGDNVVGQVKITDGTEVANVNASNQLEVEVKNASLTVDATGSGDVPVTLDGEAVVLGAGSAAIGKLAANSGVDIGDVDVTSISAGTNTIGGVIAAHQTDSAYDGTTSCTIKRSTGLAASGTVAMVAAVAGKKIRVLALFLKATSATVTNVYVANDDNNILGDSSNPIPLAVDADGDNDSGFVLPWNPGGWFETDTANEALNVILSAAQDVIYAVTYIEVD